MTNWEVWVVGSLCVNFERHFSFFFTITEINFLFEYYVNINIMSSALDFQGNYKILAADNFLRWNISCWQFFKL